MKRYHNCSKFIVNILEEQVCWFIVLIANLEQVCPFVLVSLMLTLNLYLPSEVLSPNFGFNFE